MRNGEGGEHMSIYRVKDKKTIGHLFTGWDETMIWSCLQDYMGIAYTDCLESPASAQISVGDFCFFAGDTNIQLLQNRPENLHSDFAILVPQNEEWEMAIENCYGEKVTRRMRYATKKEKNIFNESVLLNIVAELPDGYELKAIDEDFYTQIQSLDWAKDLCCNYVDYAEYKLTGAGMVILKDRNIVSGASSYTSFHEGIEIEIDTKKDERRKGLASVCGAALILECLRRGWYPSWDAQNKGSLALAEKLGYRFEREYPVYEIEYK
jgi:GNAT superfamily N-acetyltransferase